MMMNTFVKSNDPSHRSIMSQTGRNARLLTLIYWPFCISSGVVWVTEPLLTMLFTTLAESNASTNNTNVTLENSTSQYLLPFYLILPYNPFESKYFKIYILYIIGWSKNESTVCLLIRFIFHVTKFSKDKITEVVLCLIKINIY